MAKLYIKVVVGIVLIAFYAVIQCQTQITEIGCSDEESEEYCVNNAQLYFQGTNMEAVKEGTITLSTIPLIKFDITESSKDNLQGVLKYDSTTIPDGPYEINPFPNQKEFNKWSGTILLGYLYGQWLEQDYVNGAPPSDVYVSGQHTDYIYNGLNFVIFGIFKTHGLYEVIFYSPNSSVEYPYVPKCHNVIVTKGTLTCTISDIPSIYTKWRFFVKVAQTTKYLTMQNKLNEIISQNPPPPPIPAPSVFPTITNANSMCVVYSAACLEDASITFYGENFVENDPNGYHIRIDGTDKGECTPQNTTNTSLTCTLHNINGTKGAFIMTIQIRLSSGEWSSSKRRIGIITLGETTEVSGWTLIYGDVVTTITEKAQSSTVTTVLTIVFAIFFAITVIVMLIICLRYKLITRTVWCTIKKQLQETQVEELRPRAAVHVKGEPTN